MSERPTRVSDQSVSAWRNAKGMIAEGMEGMLYLAFEAGLEAGGGAVRFPSDWGDLSGLSPVVLQEARDDAIVLMFDEWKDTIDE